MAQTISTAWGGYARAHPAPKPPAPKAKPPAPKAKAPPPKAPATPAKPRITTPPPVTGPPIGKITPGPGGIDPGFSRTPPGVPAVNSFDAWLASDPRVLAENPIFAARESQAYLNSGFYKDPTTGQLVLDSSNANPFSQAALIRQALGQQSEDAQNAANSRGVLFSGAQVAAQQHAQQGYQSNLSDALKSLQGILGGVATDRANLTNSLYPDYVKQLPPSGSVTPDVPKPPAAVAPPAVKPPKPPALPKPKPAMPKPSGPFYKPPGFHI